MVLVFCQTGGYDFVNFDDDHYVYDNEHINRGFTWDGLIYYAYHWHAYTYHPLIDLLAHAGLPVVRSGKGGRPPLDEYCPARFTAVLLLLLCGR